MPVITCEGPFFKNRSANKRSAGQWMKKEGIARCAGGKFVWSVGDVPQRIARIKGVSVIRIEKIICADGGMTTGRQGNGSNNGGVDATDIVKAQS